MSRLSKGYKVSVQNYSSHLRLKMYFTSKYTVVAKIYCAISTLYMQPQPLYITIKSTFFSVFPLFLLVLGRIQVYELFPLTAADSGGQKCSIFRWIPPGCPHCSNYI